MRRDYRFEKPKAPLEIDRFPASVLDLPGTDLPDGVLMVIRNCRRHCTLLNYKPYQPKLGSYRKAETPDEIARRRAKEYVAHLNRCARGVRFFMSEGGVNGRSRKH